MAAAELDGEAAGAAAEGLGAGAAALEGDAGAAVAAVTVMVPFMDGWIMQW